VQLQLPPNANTTVGQQVAHVGSVACPSAGNCVVTGDYITGDESHPWAATESGGTWQQATEVSLPADAAPTSISPQAQEDALTSVSCPSAGNCVAVGWYQSASPTCTNCGNPMTATETDGVWGPAVSFGLPPDVISTNEISKLLGIDCTARGICTTGATTRPRIPPASDP
jgi:hypothetical protein